MTELTSRVRVRLSLWPWALLAALVLTATLARPVGAAPAADEDEPTSAFLGRLLDEINMRREQAGTQRLALIAPGATAALDDFFVQMLPEVAWPGPCVHQLVDGADSGEYVLARGVHGEARGEVLACPGPEPYWTPDRTAEEWWSSPGHFEVLYGDPDANTLACSVVGVQGGPPPSSGKGKGKNRAPRRTADAASAVLCVTFHDGNASSDTRAASTAAMVTDAATTWEAEADEESAGEPEADDVAVESAADVEDASEAESAGDVAVESESEMAADEAIEPAADVEGASEAEPTGESQDESEAEPGATDPGHVAVFDPD